MADLRAKVEGLLGSSPSSYWDDAIDTALALFDAKEEASE